MSYKNKCLNMINFLNKRIENKNEKLGLSVYKPDSQNRIRLVMINKKNGSQRELSNVFLSYSALYDALYMLENVINYKRED